MSPDSTTEVTPAGFPDDDVLLLRIREFVADAADCALDKVGPDDNIYEDLGVDSLGGAAIFIDISYEFRVAEPSEIAEIATLNTAAKLVAYVKASASDLSRAVESTGSLGENLTDIQKMLPYGDAFRFVESVIAFESSRLVTKMFWTLKNPLIVAHLIDGQHIVPGVLLAEQASQTALLFARASGFVAPQEYLLLSQLRCDFRTPAYAPISITSDVKIRGTGHGHFGFMATCFSEDIELAKIKGIASRIVKINGN